MGLSPEEVGTSLKSFVSYKSETARYFPCSEMVVAIMVVRRRSSISRSFSQPFSLGCTLQIPTPRSRFPTTRRAEGEKVIGEEEVRRPEER